MPPTLPYHEIHRIYHSTQSAHSLLSTSKRHSHRSISFRHISLAHKRRFRHRRYPEDSSPIVSVSEVDNPPPPYKPTTELRPSVFPLNDRLAIPMTAPDPVQPESALLQLQIARSRATAATVALIAVCVVLGLTVCTVLGLLAYRGRFSLFPYLRRHRKAEADLGFVFIQYDDSTWGTPAKEVPKEMPSFEGEEAQANLVTSGPLTPKVEANPIPVIRPLVVQTLHDIDRFQSTLHPKRTKSGLCRELTPIVKPDGHDTRGTTPTSDLDPCSKHLRRTSHEKQQVPNALGLAIGCNDDVEYGMLASPQLAAAFAQCASEEDGAIEETEFTITDSPASNSAACGLSIKSSGSEDDYELPREGTHSMDFKRGIVVSLETIPDEDCDKDKKSPLDLYSLPRVVISASSSVASEVASSFSNRASGLSETTIDLGDFPRPPFISDAVTSTSTSLTTEIEISLGPVIGGSLGMAGRRASSAPQLTG